MIRVVGLVLFFSLTMALAPSPQTHFDPRKWVREAEEAYSRIDSYTAIFHKQERIDGKLLDDPSLDPSLDSSPLKRS